MNPKVLLIVLVLLVVLFVVGIGVGAGCSGGTAGDSPPSWMEALGGLLGGKQRISEGDVVSATCPNDWRPLVRGQGSLTLSSSFPGNRCVLTISDSSSPVRTLGMEITQGVSARVVKTETVKDTELTIDETLQPGGADSDIELQFLENGGTLDIRCSGAGPNCVFQPLPAE